MAWDYAQRLQAIVGQTEKADYAWKQMETFNFAAENISKMYNVPILAKVNGAGTDADMAGIKEKLEKL